MSWYCSQATQGFYPAHLKKRYELADTWPSDAVKISESQYKEMKNALTSGGQKFTINESNEPVLSSVFTQEDLFKFEKIKVSDSIRASFVDAIHAPVPVSDAAWNGGMESALSIDGAVRLAEQAGATEITLFDYENTEHLVDIATGKIIAAAIGIDYQTKFAQKQQLMRAIASASTETELNAITWS